MASSDNNKTSSKDQRVLLLFKLRPIELRMFRNAIIRCKTILSRNGGTFLGISNTTDEMHKESQPTNYRFCIGALQFEDLESSKRFLLSERNICYQPFLDTATVWHIPLVKPIDTSRSKVNLLISECSKPEPSEVSFAAECNQNSSAVAQNQPGCQGEQQGSQGNESAAELACAKDFLLAGKSNNVLRSRGDPQPAHIRVSQWDSKEQCYEWLKGERKLDEMFAVFGKSSLVAFLTDLTQDVNN